MRRSEGKPRNAQDVIAGGLFILLGAGGLWLSLSYPLGTSVNMGPGYFPALIFGALALVGAGICARGLLTSGGGWEAFNPRALVLIVGSLLIYAFFLRTLGFVVSACVLVLMSTYAVPGLRFHQRLLLAVGLSIFCWALFLYGLGLVLPVWPELIR